MICTKLERVNGEKLTKREVWRKLITERIKHGTSDENNNADADNRISTVACNDKVKHL